MRDLNPTPAWMNHQYTGAPDARDMYIETGIRAAVGTSHWGAWDKRLYETSATLDRKRLLAWARERPDGSLIYFDDYGWDRLPWHIRKEICEVLCAACPLFGIYRQLPVRDWYAPQAMSSNPELRAYYANAHAEWGEKNEAMSSWAKRVNVICPSLYVLKQGDGFSVEWIETYARETISQARQYGKPVIPFVWPREHFSGRTGLTFETLAWVDLDVWEALLRVIRDEADGVIWWDASKMAFEAMRRTEHFRVFSRVFGIRR